MKYTKEDLMNTWGVVESKEHAEFIIELAELHGFDVGGYDKKDNFFYTDDDYIGFAPTYKLASNRNEKQITIPLPPKEKEWPQVGDEVVLRYKFDSKQVMHTGKLLYLSRGHLIIEAAKDNDYHCHRCDWLIEKPKSKQDLLIEELHQKLLANNCSDEYLLACDIVQGKIEGLSYE